MNLNGLIKNNDYENLKKESQRLVEKWQPTTLLDGLADENEQFAMARMLENQAKRLYVESNQTQTGASFNITGDSEAWAGVALPLVRRIFGQIVAKELVSIQSMKLPSGLVFYMDFQYGDSRSGNFTEGDSVYGASSITGPTSPVEDADTSTLKGFYGTGKYSFTVNSITSSVTAFTTGSTSYTGILNLDTKFSSSKAGEFSNANGAVTTLTVPVASASNYDAEAVRSFHVAADEILAVYPQFTRVNGTNFEFVVSRSNAGASFTNLALYYSKQPLMDSRGDFEDRDVSNNAVSNLNIPTLDIRLRSKTVDAKTRKMKAQWTQEFQQDLQAYQNIDAESELTSILSEHISQEIDGEILDMLILNADTIDGWSAKINREIAYNRTTGAWSQTDLPTGNTYYTKMSWFQTLGVKLQKVSNTIHQKTLRGGANFMVIPPAISTILESIPGFASDSPGEKDKYAFGVQKIGSLSKRYDVYVNPYMVENVILTGYKGSQFLETGAVYAPYIPLLMTPLIYDPVSMTPRKGIMTRYAKEMIRPDYYGVIRVADLDQV